MQVREGFTARIIHGKVLGQFPSFARYLETHRKQAVAVSGL
jgi:hypothetical protein